MATRTITDQPESRPNAKVTGNNEPIYANGPSPVNIQTVQLPQLADDQVYEGMAVPSNVLAPEGWFPVYMTDGSIALHRRARSDFRPREGPEILAKIDDAWEQTPKPSDQEPDRRLPTALLVNPLVRRHIQTLTTWSDVPIQICEDDRLDQSRPDFKFVYD